MPNNGQNLTKHLPKEIKDKLDKNKYLRSFSFLVLYSQMFFGLYFIIIDLYIQGLATNEEPLTLVSSHFEKVMAALLLALISQYLTKNLRYRLNFKGLFFVSVFSLIGVVYFIQYFLDPIFFK